MTPLLLGWTSGINDDVRRLHLPLYQWVWSTWLEGRLPFWSPSLFAGNNMAGMGQGAAFYLPNVVFGLFDVVVAFRWWVIGHLLLATTGMFLWSWRAWLSKTGATVSGIAYGLNGFAILHLVHMNITIAAAWIPWFFLGIDLVIDRWSTKRCLVLSGSLAAVALAGHPQLVWITLLAGGIYTTARLTKAGVGLAPWLRVGAATTIGVSMAAVQLLPQAMFSRTSERPSLTSSEAFQYSAEPAQLFTSLFPHAFGGGRGIPWLNADWQSDLPYHEVANHTGIVTVALAMIAVVLAWRTRRLIAAALIAVLGLMMAIGGSTPIGHLVFELVPLADRFRVWSRNTVIVNLMMAFAAGAGVRVLYASNPQQTSRIRQGLVLGCVLAFSLLLVTDTSRDLRSAGQVVAVLGFASVSIGGLIAAISVPRSRSSISSVFIVATVALNMGVFAIGAPWAHAEMSVSAAQNFFDQSSPQPTDPFPTEGGVDRWMSDNMEYTGLEYVRRDPVINGYDPLIQADFQEITGSFYGGYLVDDRMWLPGWYSDVLRVSTLISYPRDTPYRGGWRPVATLPGGFIRWERVPRLAEAYVVGSVEYASLFDIRRRLSDESSDFVSTVYIDDPLALSNFPERQELGAVGIVLEGAQSAHGSATYFVRVSRPGALVVSIGWQQGWSARINGRPTAVTRGNGLVLAVPVEPGLNRVELQFSPPGLKVGSIISLSAIVVLAASGITRTMRSRRAH